MSENRGYVYPETGIGKPTQPWTDQASIAPEYLRGITEEMREK
jgi:hypothetical protein